MIHYAHSRPGVDKSEWQTLESHSEASAYVIGSDNALARDGQTLLSHLKDVALLSQNFAGVAGLGHIAYVCGLLHDIGKYSFAFRQYIKRTMEGKSTNRGDVHHAWQGALEILKAETRCDISLGLADLMANIIASHHGGLTDMIVDSERFLPTRIEGLSKSNNDERLAVEELQEVNSILRAIDWASVEKEFDLLKNRTPKQHFNRHLAAKFIYSCLVDADRCSAAGQEMDVSSPDWNAIEHCLNARLTDFSKQTNTSPLHAVRAWISSQCAMQAERAIGVFTLSVPTGGGKTLSSLRFAIRHARANGLKRVIYVIPYLSIIEQTANEFRKIFGDNADLWLLEHHSNFIIDSDEEDDAKRYELGTQRWDSPIVLTTMVQFLETIASNRASLLRKFHNMAEAVFIFDEIQALPVHCIHLFTQTVNFLSAICKSSVVLCTATQPHLDIVERPIRLSDSPILVSLKESQKTLFMRTNLVNLTCDNGRERTFNCAEIAAFAQSKVSEGLSTLVILNTKSEAEAVFAAASVSETNKFFLSTNLCPAHRLDVLNEIHKILKAREMHSEDKTLPILCVSTQLVEAGVDISFDCVIRAEAGLDSIVQAAGRCNRNGKSQKPCDVFVVRVADDEERLANLPDILCGKDITDRVLNRDRIVDLDSALDKYYYYRFGLKEQVLKMDCPVWTISNHRMNRDNPDGSICAWLGKNAPAREAYKNAHGGNPYPGLATAFQTAAENFSVINSHHIGVVVPYSGSNNSNEVQKLVDDFVKTRERLNNACNRDVVADIYRDRSRILRKLQQYSISIFSNQESTIRQIAAKIDDTFYFLSSDHYDSTVGLTNVQGFLVC